MQANELRIGNLMKHLDTGMVGKVIIIDSFLEEITLEMPDVDYERFDLSYTEIEAIPISEILLHKLGFIYHDKGDRGEWHVFVGEWGVFCLDIDTDGYHIENDNHSIARKLKNVHELQNAFYAITGEELAENFIEKAITEELKSKN